MIEISEVCGVPATITKKHGAFNIDSRKPYIFDECIAKARQAAGFLHARKRQLPLCTCPFPGHCGKLGKRSSVQFDRLHHNHIGNDFAARQARRRWLDSAADATNMRVSFQGLCHL
jgi:hypothetical protein